MSPIHYAVPHLPYLGKGSLLFDRFDDAGALTGFQHFGNVSTIDQETKDDKAELNQHINAVPSLIATAVKKRAVSVKFTGTDFSADHLAIALMSAGKTTLEIDATPVIAEALASATATKTGKYFATAKRNLDPATVAVKQGVTVLTLGADYTISDPVEGIIYFPLTSDVDDAVAVTIDYTSIATTFDQVSGATVPFVKGRMRFVPDPTDGPKIGVEWWVCNLSPSGKLELVKDDYGNWELEAMVLDDSENHPDNPYFLLTSYK
jgi:hypothetical protein